MIRSIKAINFQSWESLEFNIETGVTLIKGFNKDDGTSEGSGKSAIFNTLAWGLYGKLPKDVKIDEVIREGQKSCATIIEFDNPVIKAIVRSRKPNELYMINENGEKVLGKDAKETQALIEEFLGLSFETFCTAIYFAQDYDKKFITANQEEKGKILSEIQELEIFERARKEAHTLLKVEQINFDKLKIDYDKLEIEKTHLEDLINITDTRIQEKENQKVEDILQIKANIEIVDQRINERRVQYTNEMITKKEELQYYIDELTLKNDKLKELLEDKSNINIEDCQNNIDTLELQITEYESVKQQIMGALGTLNEKKKLKENLIKSLDRNNESIKRTLKKITDLDQEIEQLSNFITNPSKECPTCGTLLVNQDTTHATKEMQDLDLEKAALVENIKEISKEVFTLEAQITEISDLNATELNSDKAQIELELSKFRKAILNIQESIREAKSKDQMILEQETSIKDKAKYIETLNLNISNKKPLDLSDLDLEKNKLTNLKILKENEDYTADLCKEKAKYEENSQNLDIKTNALETILKNKEIYINQLETLKIGFREIKSYIFGSILNELMFKANEYVQELFEVPIKIIFKNEDMKIGVEVLIDGIERGLGALSGGQFRRCCLAVDLALSDIVTSRKNTKFNLKILDEYFKSLSETSMEKCLKLLEKSKGSTLLIEHNSIFKSIVNNTFMVELENKTSREVI